MLNLLNLNKWKGVYVIFSNFKTSYSKMRAELEIQHLMWDQASYVTLVPSLNTKNIPLLHISVLRINPLIFKRY